MESPLHNIRVLDLSRVLAGPWASQLLGDYGADVIKVERPGQGDDTRRWGPPWLGSESAYYLSTNRNKRSITIDLKQAGGQRLVRELAAEADVLRRTLVQRIRASYPRRDDLLARLGPTED